MTNERVWGPEGWWYLGVLEASTKSRLLSTQGSHLAACCFLELSHFLFEHHQEHIVGVLHLASGATNTKFHTNQWLSELKLNGFIMLSPHDWSDWDITNICTVQGCQGTAFIFDFRGFHLGFHLNTEESKDPWFGLPSQTSDPFLRFPTVACIAFNCSSSDWINLSFIDSCAKRLWLQKKDMSDHKSNQCHIVHTAYVFFLTSLLVFQRSDIFVLKSMRSFLTGLGRHVCSEQKVVSRNGMLRDASATLCASSLALVQGRDVNSEK